MAEVSEARKREPHEHGGITFRAVTGPLIREKTINAGEKEAEDGRRLVADLAFSDALEVKTGRRSRDKRVVYVGTVRMRAQKDLEHRDEEPSMNCSILLAADRLNSGVEARLSIVMPRTEFDRLWDRSLEGGSLELGGDIAAEEPSGPILIEKNGGTILKYRSVLTHFVQGEIETEEWFARRRVRAFRNELTEELMKEGSGSQLETIAMELSSAAARGWKEDVLRDERIVRAKECLSDARKAFRPKKKANTGRNVDNLWGVAPRDFLQLLSSLDIEEAAKAKRQYEQVWKHIEMTTVAKESLSGGDLNSTDAMCISEKEVVELADTLCSDAGMRSDTLEWACVNAMVARQCTTLMGQLDGQQKVIWLQRTGLWEELSSGKKLALQLEARARTLALGVAAIAAVSIAAWGMPVANDVKWSLAVTIVALGLVGKSVSAAVIRARPGQGEALASLMRMHDSVRNPNYNARGAREFAYQAQRAGCTINQWVLNLIDRRIERGLETSQI